MNAEEKLQPGENSENVVKVGNTVHRSQGSNSDFVHKLLLLLETKGYLYSPKYFGVDAQGREVLSFTEGDIAREVEFTDKLLSEAVLMIRQFHDATSASDLAGEQEVVCHGDLAPWNFVLTKDKSKFSGIIDFDEARPGKRSEDLAYFLWTFLELGNERIAAETQLLKIRNLCKVYGLTDGTELVQSLLNEQQKVLEHRKRLSQVSISADKKAHNLDKVKQISKEIEWVNAHKMEIENL
jgi:hypothetical protein